MKKVLVVGDTHGNTNFWRKTVFPLAVEAKVDLILQAGDFGVWPGKKGRQYLNVLNYESPTDIWFIRGTHDDTSQLAIYPDRMQGLDSTHVGDTHFWIRDRVAQLVDGSLIDIDGQTLLAVGGAVSIDREWRVLNESWWADEITSMESIERAVYQFSNKQVDFVLTHDVPEQIDIVSRLWAATGQRMKSDLASASNRAALGILFQKLLPRRPRTHDMLWLHGHYHISYRQRVNHVNVIGLASDSEPATQTCVILDIGKPDEPSAAGPDA